MRRYGITTATAVRIGQHLGAGDHEAARGVSRLSYCLCSLLGFAVAATLLLLHGMIGNAFSDDPDVVDMVGKIAPLVGGVYPLIGLFYASMATLDGQVPIAHV